MGLTKIVFCDVDGVLNNMSQTVLDEANRRRGTLYTLDDIDDFDYLKCPRIAPEDARLMLQIWESPNLYDGIPLEAGAIKGVRAMRRFARVVAITSPMKGHIGSKYRHLGEVFGFRKEDIVLAHDKRLINGSGTVLIDDRTENLLGFTGRRICFARRWNESWDESLGPRTDDWEEIIGLVRFAVEWG